MFEVGSASGGFDVH